MYFEILLGSILIISVLLILVMGFVVWLLIRMFESIQPLEPMNETNTMVGTDTEPNPLFRHIPNLRSKLAWEELGVFPTPLHQVRLRRENGRTIEFWMKREDLCSPRYGGNKVRTLQYQLGSCKVHLERNPSSKLYVIGSGGSNQVVATMAHGTSLGLNVHVALPSPDYPDIDNTLNLLSTISFGPLSLTTWDKVLPQLRSLISVVLSKNDKVFALGGNSLGGILGQMGGALELAEQIAAGEIPDVDEIYLPMGSSCTSAGLILGVCLARHLNINAFQSHRFKIVSVMIHHLLAGMNRKTNFVQNWMGAYMSVAPQFGIQRTAAFLKKLTGIDLGPSAQQFLEQEWELIDNPDYVGYYGAHSPKSAAASAYDVDLEISGQCPSWIEGSKPPPPWLCGHFSGKAFAFMLERMESRTEKLNVLFWQTKSHVQPRGKEDEWAGFQRVAQDSEVVKKWSIEGKVASALRPGKVDVVNGTSSDYRHIMTSV